jgi:hypothetical protein
LANPASNGQFPRGSKPTPATPKSVAEAAARLLRYPEHYLTAPAEEMVRLLRNLRGVRKFSRFKVRG